MNEHVTHWLEAYQDGELSERRRRRVEAHLAACPACRRELAGLRELSRLLQESPPAAHLTPPERFVAHVGLRLPRRPERPAWKQALETGWRLVPAGLLGAWAFVQAAFVVTELAILALSLGAGGAAAAHLLPSEPWWSSLLSAQGAGWSGAWQTARSLFARGGPLGWAVLVNLALTALIGLLYWSWLASWWARRQHRIRTSEA